MSAALERACAALELPVQSICAALTRRRGDESTPRRILFVSPRHGDGTTTVAACTAVALCRNLHTRVALVEANPFRPSLSSYAGCAPSPGFAEVLREGGAVVGGVVGALQEGHVPGLSLLPAGNLRPAEPLDWRGQNAHLLLGEGLRSFPFALLDAPPLLDRPVGQLLFAFADLAVLVLRAGVTTKSDARTAFQILETSGVPMAGMVLNHFKKPLPFL